jgi:hypothetical protein
MSLSVKRPTARATKEAMLQAFDKVAADYKQLEARLSGASVTTQAAASAPASASKASKNDHSSSAPQLAMDDIISGFLQLRAAFGTALSDLSAKLTTEATRLGDLRQNVAETTRQIRELHGIEVTDNSLSTVISEYEQRSESFKKESADKKEAFDKELIDTKRAWEREKADRSRAVQEANETFSKAQQRELAEYTYELARKRELDKDAYEHRKLQAQAQLDEFQKSKQAEWDDREKLVAEQEKLHADAKQKVDEAPAKLEVALKKAREEGANIARSQAKVKADLIAKDIEGEKRLFELKIKSLEETLKEQTARIDALSKQLSNALQQAQNLAVKSLESASSASTYVAVKEIALEQAKNMPKSKS